MRKNAKTARAENHSKRAARAAERRTAHTARIAERRTARAASLAQQRAARAAERESKFQAADRRLCADARQASSSAAAPKAKMSRHSVRYVFGWAEKSLLGIIIAAVFCIGTAFAAELSYDPYASARNALFTLAREYYNRQYYPYYTDPDYVYTDSAELDLTYAAASAAAAGDFASAIAAYNTAIAAAEPTVLSLADYAETGLPLVRLRQLLLFDDALYREFASAFDNSVYTCNLNNSIVRFFPREPYGPNDYRLESQLNCYPNDD